MVLLLCPELMAKSFPFISSRYALSKSFFCQIYKFSVYLALTLLSYDFSTHPNEAFILISAISLGTLSLVELRLHFLHVHIPEHAYHNLSGCFNGLLFSSCPIFCCLWNHSDNISCSYLQVQKHQKRKKLLPGTSPTFKLTSPLCFCMVDFHCFTTEL